MKSGRNPTRRSRNIGTSKQGHGQDNKLVIPESWCDSRSFYEKLSNHRVVSREIHSRDFTLIVETTRQDCVHPCTVDDIAYLLGHIPSEDMEGLSLVVLRQPKRKEQILSPVWGRLLYIADFGRFTGPAIILEAVNLSEPIHWSRSLTPEAARELERLREDGHKIVSTPREYILEPTLEAARSTMLYRTFLHEVGHWVDWLSSVARPSRGRRLSETSAKELEARYFSRPDSERESAAHLYAEKLATQLRQAGVIPFERNLDPKALEAEMLRMQDFI
ncbi:MAG: hypothetical protein V3S40_05845 [Kiloniellales bacterium]